MTSFVKTIPVAGPGSPPISAGHRANFQALSEVEYINLILNGDFGNWPDGDASAPVWFRTTGSPTLARVGPGLATTTHLWGQFGCQVASGGSQGVLEQRVVKAASFDVFDDFWQHATYRLQGISFGCFVYTANAASTRISISDGVAETESSLNSTTSAWEWLEVTHSFNAAATELTARMKVAASATAIFNGPTLLPGPMPPSRPQLPLVMPITLQWTWASDVDTGDDALGHFPTPGIPWKATGAHLLVGTAPTGAALQVQFAKSGTADLFTTKPQIAAAATTGSQACDGTYANRCFDLNDHCALDIDQKGSSVAGADLNAFLRGYYHTHPYRSWVDFEEID